MHICIIGRGVHPPWISGEDALTKEIINCLKEKLDLSLVTTTNIRNWQGYTKESIDFMKNVDETVMINSTGNFYTDSLVMWAGLNRLVKRKKVDLIHMIGVNPGIFTFLSKLSRRSRKLKLVRHAYMPPFQGESIFNYLERPFLRGVYSRLDAIFVTSSLIQSWLLNSRINAKRIFVIPPPIDHEFFKPIENKMARGSCVPHEDRHIILYMGPIYPSRFPMLEILKMFELLKSGGLEVALLIVARGYRDDGRWVSRIKEVALKMNLQENVKVYIRALNQKEKVDLYNLADIVIFPYKGFVAADPPLTLLEAMSCGKIVVASKVQSIPRIIRHGVNGLLVDKPRSQQLAETINYALTSTQVEKIQTNARSTIIDNFSGSKIAEKLLHVYDELVN
jgi:glycosyltransferase involved in cell wall biosynthesis